MTPLLSGVILGFPLVREREYRGGTFKAVQEGKAAPSGATALESDDLTCSWLFSDRGVPRYVCCTKSDDKNIFDSYLQISRFLRNVPLTKNMALPLRIFSLFIKKTVIIRVAQKK
jgi:hypothetical protein